MGTGEVTTEVSRQRAQLVDVLDRASEVLARATNQGVVSWVSPTVTAQLGWRPVEMVGRRIIDFAHPEDRDTMRAAQAALDRGRPHRMSLRLRRVDGTYARMAISMRPVFDEHGEVVGRTGGWRSLEQRPWIADPVDERALRLLAEYTSEVLLLASPDQHLLWSTAAVRELLGWEPEAVFERDLAEFVHPDDLSAVMPHLDAVTRPHDPVAPPKDLIVRLLSASGTHVWVSMRPVPLVDSDGALVGIVVSLRNIDDLFSSRQELAAERARLRATVDAVLDPHVFLTPVRDARGAIEDFVITDANPAACASQGLSLGAMRGRRISELAPLVWTIGLFDQLAEAIELRTQVALDRLLYAPNPDGSERRYDVRAVAVGDQLTCSWRDVGAEAGSIGDELDDLARRAVRLLDRDGLTGDQRDALIQLVRHAARAQGSARD